ncbi:caspase-6 [Ciona intestinalis]
MSLKSAADVLMSGVPTPQTNENNNVGQSEVDALGSGETPRIYSLPDVTKLASSEVECYQMDHESRGLAVIFNNENFHYTTRMNKRSGTDVDARNLSRIFKKLGFDVQVYKDLSCIAMLEVINGASSMDHTGNDCCFVAFLSHGDDGCVYGTDGIVQIKKIVDQFRGDVCPSLAGKPKIFLFQACRGTLHETSVQLSVDVVDGEDQPCVEVDAAPVPTLPSGSDYLFCYSVAEGYYSHRDTLYGSWFIQDFTDVMEQLVLNKGKQQDKVDFIDVLTVVNRKVSARRVERSYSQQALGKKQMPCYLSMLTKKLYLTPKK